MNNELTQRLVLVLQKKGDENIDEVRALMVKLEGQFIKAGEALADAFAKGEGNLLKFKRATADLVEHYNETKKLIEGVEKAIQAEGEAEGEAKRKRIDAWAASQREVERYMATLQAMQKAETAAAENSAMEEHLADMKRLQDALGAAEQKAAAERAQSSAVEAKALADGKQAVADRMTQIGQQRQAEGDALRARAELYARLERMGQELLEEEKRDAAESLQAQKEAAGQAIRAKAELYARLERMGQDALEEEKMRIGAELRARIDAHVRREAADEEAKAKNLARMNAEFAAAESLRNQKMLYEMAANKQLNASQVKALDDLSSSIQGVNKFSDLSLESFAKIGSGMTNAEQKSKNFAMGLMAVAHAAQDAQYGFGAVVNNIPQIAYAMGNAIPGMEKFAMQFSAVAMIGGTLINIAMPYIKQFASEFGRELGLLTDPLRVVAVSTDHMKARIEALTSKTWKIDVDYSMIEMASKRLTLLEERQKAWDSMAKSRTSIEEESGKKASDAIQQSGSPEAMLKATTDAMQKMGLLKLDTEAQRNFRAAEAEMEQIRKTKADPNTSPAAFMAASAREMILDTTMPGMRDAVRKEIEGIVQKELGAAGRGEKQKVSDLLGAVVSSPESFRAQGIDVNKLMGGLMSAEHQNIKDERESNRFAEQQEKDAKRRKKLDEDQTRDLNAQAAEHDAAVKPILDGISKKRDAITRQWQQDNDRDQERAEKHLRDAPKVAERAAKAADAASKRQEAEFKRNMRQDIAEETHKEKARAHSDRLSLQDDFIREGFAPGLAGQGAKAVQDAMKKGTAKDVAMEQAFEKMVRIAARQEQTMGVMGQATAIMLQLDQKQRALDLQMQRVQAQLGMVGAKRRTLLLPQGQGQ